MPASKHNKSRLIRQRLRLQWWHIPLSTLITALGFMVIFAVVNHHDTSQSDAASSNLVFDDEFNGPAGSAPSSSRWDIMGGLYPDRWGKECFVNDRAHIYLDGSGHLVEKATYNPGGVPCKNGSGNYESGGMDTGPATGGLFDFKYGTIVASIKVPCQSGIGLWPAFWSSGNNWPTGGEIDYLEVMKGYNGTNAKQTLHGPTTSGGSWDIGKNNIASTQWCKQYHTYGAIWSPQKIEFTIDGTVTHTITPSAMKSGWTWPFDTHDERLLLDLQVGGSGGTVTNSTFPQSMLVDYVRVYQGSGTVDTTPPSASVSSPSDGATVSKTISVTVDASDNVGVSKVTLYIDGKSFATDTAAPYTFSLDTTKYTNGTHSIYATAADAAGNQGTSTTVTVAVDNTQSSGTGGSGGGGSGSSGSGGGSGGGTSTTGTTSNPVVSTGHGVVTVTPTKSGAQPKVTVDGYPSSTTIQTNKLTNGKHVIGVTQDGVTHNDVIDVQNPWLTNAVNHLRLHPVAYGVSGSISIITITVAALLGRQYLTSYLYRRRIKRLRARLPNNPNIHVG